MNRIEKKFKELKKDNKTAIITYLTAGAPSIEKTEELVYAMERSGSSIVEIGIPFSDPLADGPVIQKAAQKALENGINLKKIFNSVENIRKNSQIPLVFLVYYNTVLAYGVEKFVYKCKEIGVDGLIIPDLPLEEQDEILPFIEETGVALIPLVALTSKDRLESIVENKSGFVYCISSLGVTGVRKGFRDDTEEFLKAVREASDIPIAIGFGISSKDDVDRFSPYVDGLIIGSAIVNIIDKTEGDASKVEEFLNNLL